MTIRINTNNDDTLIVSYVSNLINNELKKSNDVLWFVSGGSAIKIEVMISKKIKRNLSGKLTVSLADERYGEVGHADSNWQSLIDGGFILSKMKDIVVLKGKNFRETTKDFDKILENEFSKQSFKIGIFGVGVDGHTAGILPNSEALNEKDFVCGYKSSIYDRITITPKSIYMLDEAILYAMGENKWNIIKDVDEDLSIKSFPYQILKKVPLLTIFTDYKK